jgi:preprotein translocase subunit SecE
VARNRKRAKDRRSRRPDAGLSQPGVATARSAREPSALDPGPRSIERGPRPIEPAEPRAPIEREDTPSALEHATPDVELANAQLALGRPDLVGEPEFAEFAEPDADDGGGGPGGDGGGFGDEGTAGDGGGASGAGGLTPGGAGSPAHRRFSGGRLINFLQGSWRELQRVQWPDRQQVMQATGVVIGFVIVAGIFLGVADALAGKIVTFILK